MNKSLWAKFPNSAMAIQRAPIKKYSTAKADPWTTIDNIIEFGIGSGSGKCLVHTITFTNNRDAVMIKNDEQRRRAACNAPHLKTSVFGVKFI